MEKFVEQQIKELISKPSFDEETILRKDSAFPKISIVVPSYNQAQFLEKTILSILDQKYHDLELIIIDGGSGDGSVDIIKKYEKYLAFWVSEKDAGQSDGLNKGFKRATGEIIGWQNSDDIYLPGCFEKVAESFKQNPGAEIIYGNRLDIDENDKIIGKSVFTKLSPVILKYEGIVLGTQSAFWKRELFSKIGYLDMDFHLAMDYEFFLRAAANKIKFKRVPYYFGAMRRHSLSKTEMFLGKPPHLEECDKIAKKYGKKDKFKIILKIYSMAYRTVNYFLQGDGSYILSGFKRRLKLKI